MVAATIRTSTEIELLEPTRSKVRSWSARSSFTCTAGSSSPISSRKSVPLFADSMRPMRRSIAPVKAPFSWPKSSLSIRSLEIAPQFTAMKGPAQRGERSWIARATSSLPVPLSPGHEHRRLGAGDALDGAEDVPHGGAPAHHAPELLSLLDLVAQALDLALEVVLLDQVADLDAERLELEGLGHEIRGAVLHRLDGGGDRIRRRQDDDRRAHTALRQLLEQIEPAPPRHHEIEEHDVRRRDRDLAQRRVDVAGDRDVAVGLEEHAQGFLHSGLIIDDENARHRASLSRRPGRGSVVASGVGSGVGRSITINVSGPWVGSIVRRPPRAAMIVSASTYSRM